MNTRFVSRLMLLLALFLPLFLQAQVPQGIKYQAVARDGGGGILSSTSVAVRFSILHGSSSGTLLFQEVHNPVTNQFGLFSLEVGSVNTAAFSAITWGTGSKFLRIEIDPAGGTNFSVMGTDQLLSVPYALYAESSGNSGAVDNDRDSTNEVQTLSLSGNTLSISKGNSVNLSSLIDNDPDPTNELNTSLTLTGSTLNLTDAGGVLSANLSGLVNDADADPANEIQALSLVGTTLSISGGNSVMLPSSGGYTSGTGINISGTTISNTAPDQTVAITGGGISNVTGTYPNFTVTSTQVPQVLGLSGTTLSLTNGGGSVNLPAGSGGTLDQAYDFGGAGLGRTITADAGAVEITTNSSNAAALSITHSSSGVALQAASSAVSNTFPTIQATTASTSNLVGAVTGSTTGAAYALAGQAQAASSAFAAIFGSNLRTGGGVGINGSGFNGVAGDAYNVQGYGVFGENHNAASGTRPTNLAAGLNGIGFVGALGQTVVNNGAGVLGINLGSTRNGTLDNPGVEGQGFNGVQGASNTPGVGFGVISADDLGAVGDLVVGGAKNFRIDHPLDPANKWLKHAAIESNEILNLYRGNVTLDNNGKAVVTLPDYFETINIKYSYQLTAVGVAAPGIFVETEIANNQFSIAGGRPGMKVSWQVYAERNDAYMQTHPSTRNMEPEKAEGQKGKYLHPEAFGQPADKAIMKRIPIDKLISMDQKEKPQPLKIQ